MIKNIKNNFTYYHTWNSFEQMLPSCWWSWKKFRAILVCLWSWIELQCKCHCHHFFPPIFSDFGKNPQIVSFLENHCTMRRADGSLCSTMWVFSSHQCYKTSLVLSNILSWFIENESQLCNLWWCMAIHLLVLTQTLKSKYQVFIYNAILTLSVLEVIHL